MPLFSPVILRLGRRYVSRRLFQSVLLVLGVALGVAVGVAIDLANGSARRAFTLSAESIAGRATHQIVGGPSGLPSELYRQVRVELGLRESAPIVESYVRAVSLDNRPLRLLGIDPFAEAPFRDYLTTTRLEGANQTAFDALNAFVTQPGTVLISRTLADHFGLQTGDGIVLQVGARRIDARIAGILLPEDAISAQALDTLLLADIATAQELVGQPGTLSRIDLILPPEYDLERLRAILPPGAILTTPSASSGALDQMIAAFDLNLRALSLLALVVGVFLIYNTVAFSVVQRRPVIGVLRALGATRAQVFALILGEASLLGLIGTVLGLALGIILGRAVVGVVAQTISDLYFAVSVERVTVAPGTLITGTIVGLFASVIGAAVPAWDATRTPPAGTLRRSDAEQGMRRAIPLITGSGVALNLGGVLLLNLPTQSVAVSFAALAAIVIGCTLFTPLALVIGMRLLAPITARLFGLLGRMAPRTVSRSLSRTAVAVAALTVAVSVIVGVGVMVESFRATVSDWLAVTLGSDIFVSPPSITANRVIANVDPTLVDRLLQVEGVASANHVRNVTVLAPDYPDLPPVNLTAPSEDISHGQRRFVWNHAPGGNFWAALQAGQVMVSEPFAFRRGITPERNTITLLTDRGPQTFTVFGVFYDYSTDQGALWMADTVYRRYFNDPYLSSIGLNLAPGADLDATIERVRAAVSGQDLIVRSNRALRQSALDVFDRTFAITGALQLLATVVAFIGILSALMSLQLEQTRQYGVLRAAGMTPRQLGRYTLLQTGLMGATAGLLALPIGVILALVLIAVINVRSFGWTMALTLPPGEFAQAFAVALAAALLAGLYPAWRIGRLAVSAALRME